MKSAVILASAALAVSALEIPVHKYLCLKNVCVQQPISFDEQVAVERGSAPTLTSLRDCEATCGSGNLWPLPQKVDYGTKRRVTIPINVAAVTHKVTGTNSNLVKTFQGNFNDVINAKNLDERSFQPRQVADRGSGITVTATIKSKDETLNTNTDESYSLSVDKTNVKIEAATVYGYRHALTTLAQLIDYSDLSKTVRLVSFANISDKPAYPHRGVVLDTSRNFYPVASLKRLIKTMGANKLNTFHWHFTDSGAFPLEIKGEERINQYGVYSASQIYTHEQVKDLVAFGKTHGVRIVPEVDVPAHAGAGWQWGPDSGLGELTLCYNQNPWFDYCLQPPCGQLNPLNENLYPALEIVYNEVNSLFDADIFHLGGDEVSLPCWNSSKAITDFIKDRSNKTEFFELWAKFQERTQKVAVGKNGKKVMLWSSDLTVPKFYNYIPKKNTIVQVWSESVEQEVKKLTNDGYPVVVSNWDVHYLDCGFGGWVNKGNGWCAPYKSWQVIYDFDISTNVTEANKKLVLGSEVAMWSEIADEHVVEAKVWPRAAALAERLWSNPKTSWKDAMSRFRIQRDRIAHSGIGSDAVHPHWCRQNPGECNLL